MKSSKPKGLVDLGKSLGYSNSNIIRELVLLPPNRDLLSPSHRRRANRRISAPPTGEALLATIALGFFILAVRSREESEESIDSVEATLDLLDLTLLPMEEESGERPDSVLISRAERKNDLKVGEREEESRYGDRKKSSRGREKETKGIRRRNRRGRIENPRNTLPASGERPRVNTNLETNIEELPLFPPNFWTKIRGPRSIDSVALPPFLKAKDHSLKDPWILPARTLSSPRAVQNPELQPRHLQKIRETTTRLRSNTKESILTWVQNEFRLEWNPG
ncbi:hypothetical protein HID58_080665 [Brassica napus]|uniref:Uncharacterized protein n=1 Tax=Brassica napus TaxID=3708 RepID=A0ABQ7Y5I8_BRANA|nr:hypothetical protein HID58_080665 [Brassica napus]